MTCKDCIHSGLCYKENDFDNFPDRCGSFISDKVLDERPQGEFTDLERKVTAGAINYLLGAELLEENGYTEEVINALKSVLQKVGAEEDPFIRRCGMTNKEAIKLIQGIEEDGRNVTSDHVEALNLAIKALEFTDENYPKTFIDYLNGEQI